MSNPESRPVEAPPQSPALPPPAPLRPRPVDPNTLLLGLVGSAGAAIVAAGVFFVVIGGTPHRTAGATRSMQLELEQRQAQIQEAEARQAAATPVVLAETPAPADTPR